jgi:hypothetical protein
LPGRNEKETNAKSGSNVRGGNSRNRRRGGSRRPCAKLSKKKRGRKLRRQRLAGRQRQNYRNSANWSNALPPLSWKYRQKKVRYETGSYKGNQRRGWIRASQSSNVSSTSRKKSARKG